MKKINQNLFNFLNKKEKEKLKDEIRQKLLEN